MKKLKKVLSMILAVTAILALTLTPAGASTDQVTPSYIRTNGYTQGTVMWNGDEYMCSLGVGYRSGEGCYIGAYCDADIPVVFSQITAKYDTEHDGIQTGKGGESSYRFTDLSHSYKLLYVLTGVQIATYDLTALLSAEGSAVFMGDSPVTLHFSFVNR